MFVFEDIKGLDDRAIRELLKEVSNEELTQALKGASEELRDKFFKNLSERAATMAARSPSRTASDSSE